MTNETRKIVWDTPQETSEKQERREHDYGLRNNLLTLLFAGIIILSGFLLPTLIYPYIDVYRNETFHLKPPSDSTLAKRVFDDPLPLYPWNIYDEQRLRPLTTSEGDLLSSKGIPEFLLATLRDYGWKPKEDFYNYQKDIIGSFQYLEADGSTESGYFILFEADIDEDGQKDLTCALDQQGNVISQLFLGDWDPEQTDYSVELDTNKNETPSTPNGQEGDEASQEQGDSANQNTTDPDKEGALTSNPTGPNQDDLSRLPIDEERNLWGFAYAISREAHALNQQPLYLAFRKLELNYENRYGYSYATLFPVRIEEPEELPAVEYVTLTAIDYVASDSLLYIYNLSNEERLILYLDPATMHCTGFSLQRY